MGRRKKEKGNKKIERDLGLLGGTLVTTLRTKKKQACFISPGRQDKQVMQNIHEFVINNCVKCFYICFMVLGSKCVKQSQVYKNGLKDFHSI